MSAPRVSVEISRQPSVEKIGELVAPARADLGRCAELWPYVEEQRQAGWSDCAGSLPTKGTWDRVHCDGRPDVGWPRRHHARLDRHYRHTVRAVADSGLRMQSVLASS